MDSKASFKITAYTIAILLSVSVLVFSILANAQSTDPALQQLQKEVDRAKLQADLAQYQQTKAQADADAFKSLLGGIATKGQEGTAKLEDVTIEANYLAYCAAARAAQNLVTEADPAEGCTKNVVFFTQKEQDALQSLRTLKVQLTQVSTSVKEFSGPLMLVRVPATVLSGFVWENKDLYGFEAAPGCVVTRVPEQVASGGAVGGEKLAPAAIFAAIDVGLGVISLFKTDTEIHGVSITPDELALQALIIRELREQCNVEHSIKIVHPAYFFTSVVSTQGSLVPSLKELAGAQVTMDLRAELLDSKVKQPLVAAIDALKKANSQLAQDLADIQDVEAKLKTPGLGADEQGKLRKKKKELEDQDAAIRKEALNKYGSCDPPAPCAGTCPAEHLMRIYLANQARTESRIATLKAISLKISELNKSLTTADTSGVTPLQTMLRVEALRDATTDNANLLVTKFVSIGGNNITKKNLFSTSISFSGGAIAEYVLLGPDGVIKNAGVVREYGDRLEESDFTKAAARGKLCSVESDRGNGEKHTTIKAHRLPPAPGTAASAAGHQ